MKTIISAEATRAKRGLLLCAASMAVLGAVGCASESDDLSVDGKGAEATDAPAALQAPSSQGTSFNPNGAYVAQVRTNGTGCPAGTAVTSLAPDGQTFTTTFAAFEAEVDRNKSIAVKDCTLSLDIHSPQGLSYTVQEFFYGGYLFLDEGVNARQLAHYYFQGNPAEGEEVVTEFDGPKDESFLVQDTRKDLNLVSSRCGETETLNVRATLRLRNSGRRDGYVNIAAVDASTKLIFKLSWKPCRS